MSLISCTECKKEISDQSNVCPHCGCPNSAVLKKSIPNLMVKFLKQEVVKSLLAVLLLPAIALIGYNLIQDNTSDHEYLRIAVVIPWFLLSILLFFANRRSWLVQNSKLKKIATLISLVIFAYAVYSTYSQWSSVKMNIEERRASERRYEQELEEKRKQEEAARNRRMEEMPHVYNNAIVYYHFEASGWLSSAKACYKLRVLDISSDYSSAKVRVVSVEDWHGWKSSTLDRNKGEIYWETTWLLEKSCYD